MEGSTVDATASPASTTQSTNHTTHETGSLTQQSPHESRFIGSSSGVYFINTVKQAFENSVQQDNTNHLPAAEETVGGEDDFAPSARNSPERGQFELNISSQRAIEVSSSAQLGSLPPYETAQLMTIEYFKIWHPIVPFLSGSAFLQELENLYQDPRTSRGSGRIPTDRKRLCNLIIFQCVIAVGGAGLPSSHSIPSALPSRSNLLSLVASLASKHDILTVQTLLAAQVYCLSTLALRTASSIGGLLCKLLFHAGLHRCPYRYPQLSNDDRDLRKRILWSAYALDRYLCQALGIPVSLSDAEIDVCLSGRQEIHGPATHDQNGVLTLSRQNSNVNGGAAPRASAETGVMTGGAAPPTVDVKSQPEPENKLEVILANFVDYGKLAGRVMDVYHTSLHSRAHDPRKVLFLRSDVDRWFNSMPEEPIYAYGNNGADEQIIRFLPFLHVLYEQLKISIHRPALSLPRTSPEFHHALQVTIRAAKRTILALERQTQLFWPGYVASVWMSGLIISFACQINLYNTAQGSHEILRCLDLLKRMGERWRSAQRCYAALSTLLSDLQKNQQRTRPGTPTADDNFARPAKRQRLDGGPGFEHSRPFMSASPTSQPDTSNLGKTAPQQKGGFATPMTGNSTAEWDVNDFFADISWENLFDIGDIGQDTDMQFFGHITTGPGLK
ncbi:hypothetical protein CB0940_10147 [Cercospora beticola]|uniref:Xylanolytic transcriptional activator regulatory domain-containing protein n=1 Tax=Cercospora beticola TaxID=122368 RepID=A0A2G5HSY4_CERBT|nr:hypothetical protein CB0940_10147 [Cercospora beticola]PIA95638.1 hypothetical protein CB0940_10147 [Cercospora beticola]WPB06854.1 hypothetical protein RHO25_011514 [Cercospora beticola]CAK1366778.1 unnamed protein product [Cercospora beticola]